MKFDDLDHKMRIYETSSDACILPEMFMIARLDGRGFTKLTKDVCQFEAPFDVRFKQLMTETAQSLMTCGFQVIYAYTESDEISLLFSRSETTFNRKLRKFNSVLAGQASAQFSLRLGQAAVFDCRISQLPREELVVDYFRWRNEDAARNALSAWCYWTLRKSGVSAKQADQQMAGLSTSQKQELLFQHGINFNDLPTWQKRGIGLYWESYGKEAINPLTDETVTAQRRRIKINENLPMKQDYSEWLMQRMN